MHQISKLLYAHCFGCIILIVTHRKQLIDSFRLTPFKVTLYILWLFVESTSLCLLPNDIIILAHLLQEVGHGKVYKKDVCTI